MDPPLAVSPLMVFFAVQIFLGLILYTLVLIVLILFRSECFKGSYYVIAISLGIAEILNGWGLFFLTVANASERIFIDLHNIMPLAFIGVTDLLNILNGVVIFNLLSITIDRVAAVGFGTTKIGKFVNTKYYGGLSLIFGWGCGFGKALTYVLSKCHWSHDSIYEPITCGSARTQQARILYTVFVSVEFPIVTACVALHLLLAVKMIVSRVKVNPIGNKTRKTGPKLILLGLVMTLTLLIPNTLYALAFAGVPNLGTHGISLAVLEGFIMNGVGNAFFHVLFNSSIRKKLPALLNCKNVSRSTKIFYILPTARK